MKKGSIIKLLLAIISGALLLHAAPAHSQANVYWDSLNTPDDFSPATVGIAPGGNVSFWDIESGGLDLSLIFAHGSNFTVQYNTGMQITFQQSGVYRYTDQYASSGNVVVVPPPTVTVTSPTNNAAFPAPATFTVQATASASAGDSINDVQFFLDNGSGANSIADVFSPPYTTGVTNLAAGAYTLTAIATDVYGLTGTNAITFTVTGGAPVALNSPRLATGQFLFDMTGLTAGKTNVVLVSTDLASWIPVQTNIASSASFTVTNSTAAGRQFYRIVQLP